MEQTGYGGYKFKYYRVMGRKYGLMYKGASGEWPQHMIIKRKEKEAKRRLYIDDKLKADEFK